MREDYPYDIVENPIKLARLSFWSEEEYGDLLACQKEEIRIEDFNAKYLRKAAILCLDITGFTKSTLKQNALYSFFRILDIQKVCYPVFEKYNARTIHSFADNLTAIFDNPEKAVDAALEVHHRINLFNQKYYTEDNTAQSCIGIGYGDVYTIGPDKAMGDEMNRASKLGEDYAKGSETLITENVYNSVRNRNDLKFILQMHTELPFPFYLCSKTTIHKKKRMEEEE